MEQHKRRVLMIYIHASELLEDYHGHLQVDGYDGYAPIIQKNKITRLGCWAHLRRKYFDAFKSSGGKSIGKQGLIFIKKIYEIENKINNFTPEDKFLTRLTHSMLIIRDFKTWVDNHLAKVVPDSLAGKALKYTQNEWNYLLNCFAFGEFNIEFTLKVTGSFPSTFTTSKFFINETFSHFLLSSEQISPAIILSQKLSRGYLYLLAPILAPHLAL